MFVITEEKLKYFDLLHPLNSFGIEIYGKRPNLRSEDAKGLVSFLKAPLDLLKPLDLRSWLFYLGFWLLIRVISAASLSVIRRRDMKFGPILKEH